MLGKTKTKRQVAYLLSKGSPLSRDQKDKLKTELHKGEVRVVPNRRRR